MKTKKLLFSMLISCISLTPSAQWSDQNSGLTNDLQDVYFVNSTTGWAVGRQGKILHTTNSGATWSSQNSGTTKDLNKVFMVNTSLGYAVGDDGTFIKYNGSNWSSINISYSQDMHGVYFISPDQGWISGDWGRIMMTTNGGASWTTQMDNSTYTNLFYDLHMLNSNDGWAVGTSGRVLHYNGTNWSNFSTPALGGPDLYSVSFSDASNGFMTGKNSTIYYYNGTSWSAHSTDLPDNSFHVYSVSVVSNSLAYAATTPGFGGAGIILKYNGSTWSIDYQYTGIGTELFYGIHFPSASKGFAVGVGGMIKTKGGAVGLDEENETPNLMIWPNPFQNELSLKLLDNEEDVNSLTLLDMSGRRIMDVALQPGQMVYVLDVPDLSPGTYFIQIQSSSGSRLVRVIRS